MYAVTHENPRLTRRKILIIQQPSKETQKYRTVHNHDTIIPIAFPFISKLSK